MRSERLAISSRSESISNKSIVHLLQIKETRAARNANELYSILYILRLGEANFLEVSSLSNTKNSTRTASWAAFGPANRRTIEYPAPKTPPIHSSIPDMNSASWNPPGLALAEVSMKPAAIRSKKNRMNFTEPHLGPELCRPLSRRDLGPLLNIWVTLPSRDQSVCGTRLNRVQLEPRMGSLESNYALAG
jgi:hypothetical protein